MAFDYCALNVGDDIGGAQVVFVDKGLVGAALNVVVKVGFYCIDRPSHGAAPGDGVFASYVFLNALDIADIGGGCANAALDVDALIAGSVRPVTELGNVPTLADFGGFVEGAVLERSAIAAGHVAVVVVGVGGAAGVGDGVRAGVGAVAVAAYSCFAGDVAQAVVFHILLAGA